MAKADLPASNSQAGPLPRWGLAVVAGLHGLIFAWAGAQLPWSEWSSFALLAWLLALGHFATALCAAAKLRRPLIWAWRLSSLLALAVLGWLSWELTSAASYLAGLYGDLGQGLGAAMLAIIGLLAVLTLPLSAWGLAATWERRWNRGAGAAATALTLIWTVGAWRTAQAARPTPLPLPAAPSGARGGDQGEDLPARGPGEAAVIAALPSWDELAEAPAPPWPQRAGIVPELPPLHTLEPVACVPDYTDPERDQARAVLTYLVPAGPKTLEHRKRSVAGRKLAPLEVVSRCVEAPAAQLPAAIAEQLRSEAARGPVKIDLLRSVVMLHDRDFVLDMLALRPGRDGICDAERCLMPWQLVAADQFVSNEPVPWIPDFRFGVSPVRLQRALGGPISKEIQTWDRHLRRPKTRKKSERDQPLIRPEGAEAWTHLDGLLRIETTSLLIDAEGGPISMIRMHERPGAALDEQRLRAAQDSAERYIAAAQLPEGRFTYTLDPFTGRRRTKAWNLPRQAGTTLVTCELGRDAARTKEVAARSLAYMAEHARQSGEVQALIRNADSDAANLGSTALPAIAFARCRARVGDEHDALIADMSRFLMAMQREDGSFYPKYDVATGAPIDGPEPMYAGGQAIFALSLAEKLARDEPALVDDPEVQLPPAEVLADAVERAMNYYAGPYWDNILRDFFWLEENWHCLAARASLGHHRNPDYEQFCLDYMAFKARPVLDEDSRVDPEFLGGYSMGNILVPVNTPSAGFGEGLAAAMAIKRARGEDVSADQARMREVLGFLVRQQWNPRNCFACVRDRQVIGGFSESMGAPEIRIDYTQHAWAALGHGGAQVFDTSERAP
ncbi:hypothetical protein G6O69_03690 [Pseudenhygromyxa sp. WMMC2535]|uniref:hypothetical protein n=1 Tax=Pseudenhygromyxa sp. WMMC2535 TaxID=2712867 RepID=UPI001551FE1A|nr:hypothetical protein [Pseudenhygromyxa sp. WMMC2535]NVB36918.1 hypothetical protein [Pseudenhygromyxa sp. WMMC2535]